MIEVDDEVLGPEYVPEATDRVVFTLSGGRRVTVRYSGDEDYIEIVGNVRIFVEPRAANLIFVHPKER